MEVRLSPLARSALWFAQKGWPVFPVWMPFRMGNAWACACKDKQRCERPAKHPVASLVPKGLRDASTNEKEVRKWWVGQMPLANIGLRCGDEAGVWVLDIDVDKGGFDSLAQLEREVGGLPRTLTAETGSGGLHLYFRHPGRQVVTRNNQKNLGAGLDVRGDGGYVLTPPSRHISGRNYRWTVHMPPACAPVALLERVMAAPEPLPEPAPEAQRRGAPEVIRERARRYVRKLPPAISGQGGHAATFLAALHLVKGFELDPREALELLELDFNPRCQPAWKRKELIHKIESAQRSQARSGYLLAGGKP